MSAKSEAVRQTLELPADHELVITRVLHAPRKLVWRAWTEREHMMRWSCPKDFTILFCESNLRIGGAWRAGMRSPEGEEFVMGGKYCEIAPPEYLAFTHGWENDEYHPGHVSQITVVLEENDGGTKMIFKQTKLATAASRDGHAQGWSGAFDNLSAYLEAL